MMHGFFNTSLPQVSTAVPSMYVSSYDLQIKATSLTAGLEAETNRNGVIVAVKYPNGTTLRRHADYVVTITNGAAWFCDRWGSVHPFD